jgi:glycosyltransferase involved in cell wall biosynthesis
LSALKKILIISDAWHPQVNGVVRTYEHVIEELEKRDFTMRVIGPADFPRSFNMPGYSEIKLALLPYKKLSQLIDDFAPDGIHIATEGPLGWAARKYCVKRNIGYSSAYHTHFPDYLAQRAGKYWRGLMGPAKNFGIWYTRTFHSTSKAMLVATKSLEHDLDRWKFKAPRFAFSRGVNLDIFSPEGAVNPMRAELTAPVAIYVGRIAIEKNLEAFLNMEWNGSKLLVGDGPARVKLTALYPAAHFVGSHGREKLAAYYRCGDVFVFPSKTDTFGMVLIEAMACGLPIAGYDVTGPKDIITNDFLGAIDGDLATAATKALSGGTAQQRYHHAEATYSWTHAAQEFIDALEQAIK